MNDCQYFFQPVDCLEITPDRAFQLEFQPEIRAWLTDAQTTQEQKEAFLQALLDFYDDCGGFYQVRSFLLAAEYLALCPECRQSDLIIDRLLKLSYNYFRVEQSDWCMPPEAFVRSARETLKRTDLGRVVPRLEALIRQTESRGVMRHATRELLRIQPGNRCGIAAIAFEHLISLPSPPKYPRWRSGALWQKVWQSLVDEPIRSDELAQAISQILLHDNSIKQIKRTLPQLIHLKPDHPLILTTLIDLMTWDDSALYATREEYMEVRNYISELWRLAMQANPTDVLDFMEKLQNWQGDADKYHDYIPYDYIPWLALRVFSLVGQDNLVMTQTIASLLKQLDPALLAQSPYRQKIIIALGDLGVDNFPVVDNLLYFLDTTEKVEAKYDTAIALMKLGVRQPKVITFLLEGLQQFAASDFTIFVSYPSCSGTRWALYYADLLRFEETRSSAIEILKEMVKKRFFYPDAYKLLGGVDRCKFFVVQLLLDRIEPNSSTVEYTEMIQILETLRKMGVGNTQVVHLLEQFIHMETNPILIAVAVSALFDLNADHPIILETIQQKLSVIPAQESQSEASEDIRREFFSLVKRMILYTIENTTPSQALLSRYLWQYFDAAADYEIRGFILELHQMRQGNAQLLKNMLEKLQAAIPKDAAANYFGGQPPGISESINQSIVNWLEVFSDHDLAEVVTDLRSNFGHHQDWLQPTDHAIVWQCAQRLPYQTFKQAWQGVV